MTELFDGGLAINIMEIVSIINEYNNKFPTPNNLKDELSNLRFFGQIIRKGEKLKYIGEMQVRYDDSDRAEIYMPIVEEIVNNMKGIPLPDNEEYYIEGDNIGCKKGHYRLYLFGYFVPFDFSWCGTNLPNVFPKGTILQVCFTNLLLESYMLSPRFEIGPFRFEFRETEKKYWESAKSSNSGKITNVALVYVNKDATIEELRETLFSIMTLFKIITLNRIRTPLIKFILPNTQTGYLIFNQNSGIPARDDLRMWYESYTPAIYFLKFFANAAKLTHKNRNKWNLTNFAEYLITFNQEYYVEKKLQSIILALETINTGYILDNNLASMQQIEKDMNLKTKLDKVLNKLNQSRRITIKKKEFSTYYKTDKLNYYRNMLFHQGKLPNYDNIEEAFYLSFKWLELAWFIFLRMLDYKCVFNKPPHNNTLNKQLADCDSCDIDWCSFRKR